MATIFRPPLIFRVWRPDSSAAIRSWTDVDQNSLILLSTRPEPGIVVDNPVTHRSRVALRSQFEAGRILTLYGGDATYSFSDAFDSTVFFATPKAGSPFVTRESAYDLPIPHRTRIASRAQFDVIGSSVLLAANALPFNAAQIIDAQVAQKSPLTALRSQVPGSFAALLNVVQLPFAQLDWPNPSVNKPRLTSQIDVRGASGLLAANALPFNAAQIIEQQVGQRSPLAALRSQVPGSFTALLQVPFAQFDWPNPKGHRPRVISDVQNALVLSGVPFAQFNWPVPAGHRPRLYTQLQSRLVPSQIILPPPFAQYDWPLPVRHRARLHQDDLRHRLPLPFTLQPPFAQYDWPLPVQYSYKNWGYQARRDDWRAGPFFPQIWTVTPEPSGAWTIVSEGSSVWTIISEPASVWTDGTR